jgi:ABC-type transporter Mla subunit MlaD
MSSRSQDAATVAQLAALVAGVESRLHTASQIFQTLNDAIDLLEQQTQELSEANDDLDRRILALEKPKPAIRRPVVPDVVDSDYDDDYGAYIRG